MAQPDGLRPPQTRAIAALLATRTIAEAAALAGVGERTLYRWLGEEPFRAGLAEAEAQAVDNAARGLAGMAAQALGVITDTMNDPGAGPAVRLRAAQATLDYLLKVRELRTIEERLTALERIAEHGS